MLDQPVWLDTQLQPTGGARASQRGTGRGSFIEKARAAHRGTGRGSFIEKARAAHRGTGRGSFIEHAHLNEGLDEGVS